MALLLPLGLSLLILLVVLAPFMLRLLARRPLRVTGRQLDDHIAHRIDVMHIATRRDANSPLGVGVSKGMLQKHETFHRELQALLRSQESDPPYEAVISRLNGWTRRNGPRYSTVGLRPLELVDSTRSRPKTLSPRAIVNDELRTLLDALAVLTAVLVVVGLIGYRFINEYTDDRAEKTHALSHSSNLWLADSTEPVTSTSVGEDGQLHVITRDGDSMLSVHTLPADEVVIHEIVDGSSPRLEHQTCQQITGDDRAREWLVETGDYCWTEEGKILHPDERYVLHIERGSLSTP